MNKDMKKPSKGIIIFGIIFVLCGLNCLKGLTVYFAYRTATPYIYKSITIRTAEMEEFLKEKIKENPEKKQKTTKNFKAIKQDIQKYKEKYINNKTVPLSIIAFLVISLISCGIFLFTGISVIQLRIGARQWISISFLAGLIWILSFLYASASTVLNLPYFCGH